MITEKELRTGRPRKYKTPEEMQARIDDYFVSIEKPTICGLALALGFVARKSLFDYEGYGKEFFNIIKRARLVVEDYYERNLAINTRATGAIFALKNFDWSDRQDIRIEESPFRLVIELPPVQPRPALPVVSSDIPSRNTINIRPETQIGSKTV